MFKNEHLGIFDNNSDNIDKEDIKLYNELTKVMLAIGIGEEINDIFSLCVPTRRIGWGKDNKHLWLCEYWKRICQEIWCFHENGDFDLFLNFYKEGLKFFAERKNKENNYQQAFSSYFESTKTFKCSPVSSLVGVAYELLFMRFDTIASINRYYDLASNYSNKLDRLAIAINCSLGTLLYVHASNSVKRKVVEEILQRIPAPIDTKYIMEKLNI